MTALKKYVKEQIQQHDLSFRKLSSLMGISPSYLSEILNGKKKVTIEVLGALADALDVSRADIYQAAGLINIRRSANQK